MKGYSIKYCLTVGIQSVEIDPVYGSYPKGHTYRKGDYVYVSDEYHQQLRYGINFFEKREDAVEAAEKKALRKALSLRKQLELIQTLALKAKFA